jgi:hypothetical protein
LHAGESFRFHLQLGSHLEAGKEAPRAHRPAAARLLRVAGSRSLLSVCASRGSRR